MTTDEWLDANNQYLAASLEWLRRRLELFVVPEPDPAPPARPADPVRTPADAGLFQRLFHRSTPAPDIPLLLPAASASLQEALRFAEAKRREAEHAESPPALALLADRLGLSPFERDALLLFAAAEFDPTLPSIFARVHGNLGRSHPTFALALTILEEPSWDALAAHRPLRFLRLLEINQPGAIPLAASAVRADERIVAYLKGLNVLDDRLSSTVDRVPGDASVADSQRRLVDDVLRRLVDGRPRATVPVVQLVGSDAGSRLVVAQTVCAAIQRDLYRLSSDALPSQPAELETFERLWRRESLLLPVALFVDADDPDGPHGDAVRRLASRDLGLVFVGTREAPLHLAAPSIAIDVRRPTVDEQARAWLELLGARAGDGAGTIAKTLAGQFSLGVAEIVEAHASVSLDAGADEAEVSARLWDACRDLTRVKLDSLAERLEPKATWEDLVLPAEQMALMRQIASQVRERHTVYHEWGFARRMNRGFGISALFAGESGTGKTMAAEVLANDLRLDLFRIDLSAVVSKYIGETEKNLCKLFDAAERGGAILFFDEADALFGKRSEVKDSHDRYANIEINYLLQRMEAFGGLAILATNMKSALDPAFLRRLRFVVNLPFPGVAERAEIWKRSLPPGAPVADVDFGRLARMNVSGGNIHSIVLNAAFAAAQARDDITTAGLLAASRAELRKLERPYSEAEFRVLEARTGSRQ